MVMPLSRMPLTNTNRPCDVIRHWHKEGELLLSPPYQRGDVWGPTRRRNLIRSVMLGVPIPSIIINDRLRAEWDNGDAAIVVIDGKQRITTLLRFLEDEFTVPGEWFDERGDIRFGDLPVAKRRRFTNQPLAFSEGVLASIDEEREVFELVNFGGVPQGQTDIEA